ncbi:50S ribosomal protein L11 methyltransferase [Paracoccus sp. p4-l81]|uniref:50S ribosomal protein L11 methyltransferase n=1 Tax=Paracoccus sp. p4-l81 TaxID=3342806 RepID=UPI0035B8554E
MTTFTAFTTCPSRAQAEALAEHVEALEPEPYGTGVFEIEDGSDRWEVGAYFTERPDEVALLLLAAAQGAQPFVVSELPDIDWVAHVRRELAPVQAGRFFVYGSHDADKLPAGALALNIDAAMAFGTGHHGTTKGCLLALDRLADTAPGRVADIGCGTAVLAMGAARLWPGLEMPVMASDNDVIAVETAEANVLNNGLDGKVACFQATGFDHPDHAAAAPYDIVLANILKQPLIDLAPDMAAHLAAGGRAILSGLLTTQADEVTAAYVAQGLVPEHRDDLGEWSTLVLRKP